MLDCVRSLASRYRCHVANGTREANPGAKLPISSTMALKPPPWSNKSADRSACSILDQGLDEGAALGTVRAVAERTGSTVCCFGRIERCGSAQRGAKACVCNKPDTAVESPLASVRGCGPNPPPCSPFLIDGGARYFSGREKFRLVGSTLPACTPQRTQRSRARSTPIAAADGGSKVLETSIHAQTLPACVTCARNERASDVLPEHSGPTNSLTAP